MFCRETCRDATLTASISSAMCVRLTRPLNSSFDRKSFPSTSMPPPFAACRHRITWWGYRWQTLIEGMRHTLLCLDQHVNFIEHFLFLCNAVQIFALYCVQSTKEGGVFKVSATTCDIAAPLLVRQKIQVVIAFSIRKLNSPNDATHSCRDVTETHMHSSKMWAVPDQHITYVHTFQTYSDTMACITHGQKVFRISDGKTTFESEVEASACELSRAAWIISSSSSSTTSSICSMQSLQNHVHYCEKHRLQLLKKQQLWP